MTNTRIVTGLLLLGFLGGAARAAENAAKLDVPLTIWDVAGVERKAEPCSTGVPLPHGMLREPSGLAVSDPSGKRVPAQFKVLERWREYGQDKFIKWLLVTFLADVPKGGKSVYRLRAVPEAAKPPWKNVVRLTRDAFVMNGLAFKRDFSSPFRLVLTDPDGGRHTAAGLPVKMTVYEDGPVRGCIRAETPTVPGKFGFIAWVYSYAGQKRWDMTVVLKNTPNKARGPFYFKDFSVVWEPAEVRGVGRFLLGGEWGKVVSGKVAAARSVRLYQDSDGTAKWEQLGDRRPYYNAFVIPWSKIKQLGKPAFRGYRVIAGDKELARGNYAMGWAALIGKARSAAVAVRHFRQNHPTAVEVEPGRIIVRLWPKYWAAHTGLHWLDDLQRKAYDLSFALTEGGVTAEAGEAMAKAFDAPLVAHASHEWYRTTKAKGHVGGRPAQPKVAEKQRSSDRNWVTFGGNLSDRIRRRYHQTSMGSFLSTGDPRHAHALYAAMRHSSGMTPLWLDDYRYPRDKKALTHRQYCGTARRAGRYRKGTGHHGYMSWNHAHFCCVELFDGWRLFGDPLALDAVRGVAAYCQSYVDFREGGGGLVAGTRADGHPLSNLCEAYRILGDESMLGSLRRFAAVCWQQVDKVRGNYGIMRSWEGGKELCEKPFMMSQVMDGLRAYWELTRDETAADQILGMADFILDNAFLGRWGYTYVVKTADPRGQEEFREKCTEAVRKSAGQFRMQLNPHHLLWAWRYTGEERYRKALLEVIPGSYKAHHGNRPRYAPLMAAIAAPRPPGEMIHPIKDLAAEALGDGKIRLTWSTPPGIPKRYQVKWADRPIVDRIKWPEQKASHISWWAANNVAGEPEPKPGAKHSMVAAGVTAGTRYFATRTFDAIGHRAAMSNVVKLEVK